MHERFFSIADVSVTNRQNGNFPSNFEAASLHEPWARSIDEVKLDFK